MRTAAEAAERIARAIKTLEQKRVSRFAKEYVLLELKKVHHYLEGLS